MTLLQHGDLYSLIYDLASDAGVTFDFNSKVVKVDPQFATVILENGENHAGDIIIGADGYESIVRSVLSATDSADDSVDKWQSLR
jgi:salicylate hydroxylase